jgi:ABC-type dipeptide/oligopeptide/nickel transport system permease subunit
MISSGRCFEILSCKLNLLLVTNLRIIEDTKSLFMLAIKYRLSSCISPAALIASMLLSYIGLGIQPPTPEWGAILTSAKVYMRHAWHISVFPGLFLVITVVAFNLFGDGLRDALDPKMKK